MKKYYWIIAVSLLFSIPMNAQQTVDCPRDTVDGQVFARYKVEKSIGLWRISQNFGVLQEAIINANPQLRERGLHVDEILRIPLGAAIAQPKDSTLKETSNAAVKEVETVASVETPAADTVPSQTDTTVVATEVPEEDNDRLRIALLLPLQASATQRDAVMDRFLDFYEGAMLAINDVQKSGTKMEVFVYDIEKSTAKLNQLIADSVLNKMHAIIGPAYPAQVAEIAPYSRQARVMTLVPFVDQVPGIESNPYLMQFNATEQQKAQSVAAYLEEHKKEVNCVLLEGKDADIPQGIRLLRKEIIARDIPHTWTNVHSILVDSLGTALVDSLENILIFNTEKYGNLQVLMPRVQNAKGGRSLTLYSHFAWQKERILLPQIYASVFSTDLTTDLSGYQEAYDRYFGHKHSSSNPRYDLLGYDLTRSMIAFLQGKEFYGLQSDVRFVRLGEEGGYVNENVKVIK